LTVLNIAHRGARSLAPENTLAAAHKALEVGADMWELDVGVSADGELIVFHDDSLTRVTNAETVFPLRAPWIFTTFTLSELQQLETGSAFIQTDPFGQIAAGAISAEEQAAWRGEPIPTLRQALEFTRDHNWRVNVEIKKVPPPLESFPVTDKVVALIESLDMAEQVLISSFQPDYLRQAKMLNPALTTAYLRYIDKGEEPYAMVTQLGCRAYHPYTEITGEEEIARLRDAGIEVNVWTVNEEAEMARFIQAGVSGLITDFPQRLYSSRPKIL
jgi:glycerophosphoryl diester phosphodiesterase